MLILFHVAFAFVGFYLYLSNYRLSERLLIQKTLNKQLILAKAGAASTENLLRDVENQLSAFVFSFSANIDEFSQIDKEATRHEFISYMQRSSDPVNGIALFDEKGKLSIIENRQDLRTGESQDFSHSEFITWSKIPENKNKVFVGGPYIGTAGASVGKIILVVAKPMYSGERFKGTLAIRILVDDFVRAFISPLAFDQGADSFILDSNGVMIAGKKSLLNKNLFIYAQKQKWPHYQEFIQTLTSTIEGSTEQTTWTFQYPHGDSKLLLVGISKINLPDSPKDLYLVVTTSQDSTLSSLRPFQGYGVLWLGFGVLTTTLGGLTVMLLKSSE